MTATPAHDRTAPRRPWAALALDLLTVLAFAATGRRAHEEGLSAGGVLQTAGPFVAGLLIGWVIVSVGRRGAPASLPAGVVIWVSTLVAGMALRLLTGQGAAPAFVAVATGVLALGLLGWRALAGLPLRR